MGVQCSAEGFHDSHAIETLPVKPPQIQVADAVTTASSASTATGHAGSKKDVLWFDSISESGEGSFAVDTTSGSRSPASSWSFTSYATGSEAFDDDLHWKDRVAAGWRRIDIKVNVDLRTFGARLEPKGKYLKVHTLLRQGIIPDWNSANRDQQVRSGDFIVSINKCEENLASQITKVALTAKQLDMIVVSPAKVSSHRRGERGSLCCKR